MPRQLRADEHYVAERFARGGIGQAGVTDAPFSAWIDDWRMAGDGIEDVRLTASGDDFAYDLALSTDAPLVLQGEAGYSVKSDEGQASYYYSQPNYVVTGTLTLPEGQVPVTGRAWLDREWSSQPLSDRQTGWDWFSLHLEDGAEMMGYRMRQADGPAFSVSTWIAPDGTAQRLARGRARRRAAGDRRRRRPRDADGVATAAARARTRRRGARAEPPCLERHDIRLLGRAGDRDRLARGPRLSRDDGL